MQYELRRIWDQVRLLQARLESESPPPARPTADRMGSQLAQLIRREFVRRGHSAFEKAPESSLAAIATSMLAGKRILTIKYIREITGLGIREAKDIADDITGWIFELLPTDIRPERGREYQ